MKALDSFSQPCDIRRGRAGCQCEPSQKGWFFEAPQRHNATPRTVAQGSPFARQAILGFIAPF